METYNKPWRRISLGHFNSYDKCNEFLYQYSTDTKNKINYPNAHYRVTPQARLMMKQIQFAQAPKKMGALVKVTPLQLGFDTDVEITEIIEKAQELGLTKCDPEVGPILRIEYEEQPILEGLFIGMDPMIVGGESIIFLLGKIPFDPLKLDGFYTDGYKFVKESKWIFRLPAEDKEFPF